MNALKLEVRPVNALADSDRRRWLDMVSMQAFPSHEQLLHWGAVEEAKGWVPLLIQFHYDDCMVGGALVLTKRRRVRVASIRSGPIFSSEALRHRHIAMDATRALIDWARQSRFAYLFVQPCLGYGELEAVLSEAGLTAHSHDLPPQGLGTASALLDLSPSEEEIFARFRRSTRNYLYQSAKRGITVREGNRTDLPRFFALIESLCRRRGVTANVPGIDYLARVWDHFHAENGVRLDVATYQGEDIAAMMSLRYAKTVYLWRIGWTGTASEARPTEALYWHAIRAEKAKGALRCDMNWIDIDEVERIRSGDPALAKTSRGITSFKLGFSPEIVRAPQTFDYFPNPAIRLAVKWGAPGWAKCAKRFMRRLRTGMVKQAPSED